MRTYQRNVRRAWDGEDHRASKRARVDLLSGALPLFSYENATPDDNLEDTLERAIRETSVAALSSSPSRKNSTVFSHESQESDNGSSTMTPPSSPPAQALEITPPNIKPRKPTFAALKKKQKDTEEKNKKRKFDAFSASEREESQPLSEIRNSSSRPFQSNATAAIGFPEPLSQPRPTDTGFTPKPPPPRQNFVQTVLDLGQSLTPISCYQCGMSYTPSVSEDAALHNMYHNRHSSGIELGKPFLKSAMRWCYEVQHIPGSVVVVDRKISVPGRKIVKKVLEVVNKELGSVEISEEELWSQRPLEGEGENGKKMDRYKVFLHVIDGKCVAVCLAERISKGYRVKSSKDRAIDSLKHDTGIISEATVAGDVPAHPSSAIEYEDEPVPAVVGVSRIWTSEAFRKKGIANNLLECVMNQFVYGMDMERSDLAFSQPTESGAALARSWFGADAGWLVYKES